MIQALHLEPIISLTFTDVPQTSAFTLYPFIQKCRLCHVWQKHLQMHKIFESEYFSWAHVKLSILISIEKYRM